MPDNGGITINLKESSVAEFTKRPLPTDAEMRTFEDRVIEEDEETDEPAEPAEADSEREEEIEESLNEIYQDEKGRMVDVKRLDVKKRRGILFWFFNTVLVSGLIGGGAYYGYNFLYLSPDMSAAALDFTVEGKTEVLAGEEFFYTLAYKNTGNVAITEVLIEVSYPDNFIFLDSSPAASDDSRRQWKLMSIPAQSASTIRIKGSIVGRKDEAGILAASIRYMPENFSSEFKKEATLITKISDIGLELYFDYLPTALVGNEHEIYLVLRTKETGYINSFRATLEPQENIEIINRPKSEGDSRSADFTVSRPGVWLVDNITGEDKVLPIRIKVLEKAGDRQELVFNLEKPLADGQFRLFERAVVPLEILKSDLNLTLIINGSRENQSVNLGDTLNYSIVFNNKGETDLADVSIMAVMDGGFLDFASLNDPAGGREKGNTITWTKAEIPALETIKKHQEGTIDYSITLFGAGLVTPGNSYAVKSYAQYVVGEREGGGESGDNRSNEIVSAINSDLKLVETVRYFSEDNIPVGTGPHPPRVGETTSYKVYWEINNNLHELGDATVSVALPKYIGWAGKERATAGTVSYDSQAHAISWEIGRMPVSIFSASAEFSIAVVPGEEDRNKIMVLLPGSSAAALDAVTGGEIKRTTKAKTTRLEDDGIAVGDGIVD